MSIVNIQAKISCDECGEVFHVRLDPADKVSEEWTLFDLVEDEIRGGTSLVDENSYHNPLDSTSIQDGKTLCVSCTMEADKENESRSLLKCHTLPTLIVPE